MNDELKNFFEVVFALRNQCEESGDPVASDKIDALAKVCAEVVKAGKIPPQFDIEENYPINTELVESLFSKLSIEIKDTFRYLDHRAGGKEVYCVTFCTF